MTTGTATAGRLYPPDGLALLDTDGCITHVDAAAGGILGGSNVCGSWLTEHIAAPRRSALLAALSRLEAGQTQSEQLVASLVADGRDISLDVRVVDGRSVGYAVMLSHARREASGGPPGSPDPDGERAERRGDHLVDAVPMGLAVVDPDDASLLWCNRRLQSLLGLDLARHGPLNLVDVLPNFSVEQFEQRIREVGRTGETRFERSLRRMDGSEFLARLHVSAVQTSDGERVLLAADNVSDEEEERRALASLMETTATMRGRAAFHNLARRLSRILDVKAFGVVEHDEGSVSGHTRAWVVRGRILPDYHYEFAGTPCAAVAQGMSMVVFSDVQSCFPRDGDFVGLDAVSYAGIPLRSHDRIIGHLVIVDDKPVLDSERLLSILSMYAPLAAAELLHERHGEEIAEMNYQVQRTQRLESLGVLAGGIAHDFNNLLMSVLGHADLAERHLDRGVSVRRDLEQMRRSVTRAADLCNQLLAYAGKGRYRVQDVSVDSLLAEIGDLLEVSVSKNVSLRLELPERSPVVRGDPSQLSQVLMNLITNASDAVTGPEGEVWVRCEVMHYDATVARTAPVDDLAPGDYVRIEISDTGSGMTEAVRERIFEPFFSTKERGRGLGLAAVLGIVRGHGGGIRVLTSPGEGTQVNVYLPASRSRAGSAPTVPPCGDHTVVSGLHVLVVDDERTVLETVGSFVQMLSATFEEAVDGLDALERVRDARQPFDLVILDLTMPRLGGVETLERLRSFDPRLPVVLMSGYSDAAVSDQLRQQPSLQFLQKPFGLASFTRAVAMAMQGEPNTSPGAGG